MPPERKGFRSFDDVFRWISGFINLERGEKVKSFSLERMKTLCALAGNPERCAPVLHTAGSKGKGSVTAMMSAILTEAGFRCARYMSPHVSDPRERIGLGNAFFDEDVYLDAGETMRRLTESIPAGGPYGELFPPGEEPTYFELLTLYFFLCARKARCEVMAVETGLGGRLDATNVVDPAAQVITLIELEHTGILGNTLGEIAREKAGIIKPGKPLVLGAQREEALEVLKSVAAERHAPLCYFPETAAVEHVRVSREGTEFTLKVKGPHPFETPLRIPLPGKVQAENAGLAALAVRLAFPAVSSEALRRGLASVSLPGRFETIPGSPPVVVDGAHTEGSVRKTAETFARLYGRGVLLFGCAADKNAGAMARELLPFFPLAVITAPGTFKASDPAGVCGVFRALGEELLRQGVLCAPPRIELAAHTPEAIALAVSLGKEQGLPVLATGSFYLAGEVRDAMVCRA